MNFIIPIGLCTSILTAAQEPGPMRFLRWTYRDPVQLASGVTRMHLLYGIGGLSVLALLSLPKDRPAFFVREHYHGGPRSYFTLTNYLGGNYAGMGAAGIFAGTLLTRNHKLQDAAFTSIQSFLYAGLVTGLLKRAIGRYRPIAGNPEVLGGQFKFKPFFRGRSNLYRSFPSGHVTNIFAILTPWVCYYPNYATYSLFALSTGTAIARLGLDMHWTTDVVGGAAVGFIFGYSLSKAHQKESKKVHLTPVINPTRAGLNLICLF